MELETGKEMDRCCVFGWLNEVYRHPTVAFNTYSDEQQIEFAHDALVLLKEQEAVEPISFMDGIVERFACKKCGKHLLMASWARDNYCSKCGQKVKWE